MSAEYEDLITIKTVVGRDTPEYNTGDVENRFSDDELIEYVSRYGHNERLLRQLSFLQHAVWTIYLGLPRDEGNAETQGG